MSRIRTIYNVESLYVGPAPSTGFHFVDYHGAFNDSYDDTSTNINLVKSIYRVQNVSYGFNVTYTDILNLGSENTVHRSIINPPTVNLDFSYLQQGIVNELRCGFYSNYTQIYGNVSGSAFYSNNTGVSLLSGFTTRDLVPGNNELHYPQSYRDKRNLFLIIGKEGYDVNPTTYSEIHSGAQNLNVVGFGNAYLTNYSCQAAVGSFPTATMSYLAENMACFASGTGVPIPALDYSTRNPINGKHFNIPNDYQGATAITALKPGDITLNITSLPSYTGMLAISTTGYGGANYSDIYNLGFSYNDIKIQNYSINLPLNRDTISAIGSKLPIDRPLNFPIFVDFSFGAIIGDNQTGSIDRLLNKNDDYNISIQLKNPNNSLNNPNQISIQYDMYRAKFNSITYQNQIGGQKSFNADFRVEMKHNDFRYGFFMSGLLNIEALQTINGNLLKEDGFNLLQEDGSKILVTQISPLF